MTLVTFIVSTHSCLLNDVSPQNKSTKAQPITQKQMAYLVSVKGSLPVKFQVLLFAVVALLFPLVLELFLTFDVSLSLSSSHSLYLEESFSVHELKTPRGDFLPTVCLKPCVLPSPVIITSQRNMSCMMNVL